MTVKITGLSANNVAALRETIVGFETWVEITATTAIFSTSAQDALNCVNETIAQLPGRGHPRASLYAVARKLKKQL